MSTGRNQRLLESTLVSMSAVWKLDVSRATLLAITRLVSAMPTTMWPSY